MAMKFEKLGEGKYLLDVCGYVCPHPQIYTKKSLEKMQVGDVLELVFDNPSSGETIVQMCDQAGHEIKEKKQEGSKLIYIIEKS
jgi:tRNA 2-thiouridine synthesizing protein A